MVIIHSDREGFTNFDNVLTVKLMGRYIHADLITGHRELLAVYNDADRAIEVFQSMMEALFPDPDDDQMPDKVIPFINSSGYYDDLEEECIPVFPGLPPQYYYMPKE